MDWIMFIAPATIVLVELLKRAGVPTKWLPHVACVVGLLLGLVFGFVYGGDLFARAFEGLLYGAAASGIWDLGKSTAVTISEMERY